MKQPGIIGLSILRKTRHRRLLSTMRCHRTAAGVPAVPVPLTAVPFFSLDCLTGSVSDQASDLGDEPSLARFRLSFLRYAIGGVFGVLCGSEVVLECLRFRGLPLLRNVPTPSQVSRVTYKRHVAMVSIQRPCVFLGLNKPFPRRLTRYTSNPSE